VSKSQYGMVKDEEIPQIYAACKEASTKKKRPCAPKLTVIVVGKRHHARFFESHDSEYNLSPGLCIYHTVTAPNQFSFYLQSRHSQLRIARSGHYVVIENESRYKPKNLQLISNKLCFVGSRATTGLSTCVPARYADILCNRLRCYMKPVLDGDLTSTLFNARVHEYHQSGLIWVSMNGNPWKESLNDRMFYLEGLSMITSRSRAILLHCMFSLAFRWLVGLLTFALG